MSSGAEGKLSKEEVETLLQATQEEEEQRTQPAGAERAEPSRRVHSYDFTQPNRFNKSALEKLRRINDQLTEAANTHASRLLRTSMKTQLVSMDQMKWENLVEEVGESVVGYTFTMEPLGFHGLLSVARPFAGTCLDRMMGGPGEASEVATEFTDLDVRAFAKFAWGFLEPLPEVWQNVGEFSATLGRFVGDLPGLDLYAPREDLFQLSFLMQGNIGSGQVALTVPFQAVRSLPPQSQEPEHEHAVAAGEEAVAAGLRESLRRTSVELSVVLGSTDIRVARLVRAEPGDVIVLDTRIGDPLKVKVNDRVKFRAYPGLSQGKYAAKLIMEE